MSDLIAAAILKTLTYSDLFDYPLAPEEIHRYLIGVRASREEIDRALFDPARLNGSVARVEGFVTLPRRQSIVASRVHWREQARGLWRRAHLYARILSHAPFIRMLAVSGGLAMDNARDNDIDLLIVTAPGRLWLARAFAVALVRVARLRGDKLCPNFLLTENALALEERNLYTAHELVQLVPLYGFQLFRKMFGQNRWTESFLPNAAERNFDQDEVRTDRIGAFLKQVAERMLGGTIGDAIERWEMARKISKLSAQIPANADGVIFSAEMCRGFFSGHQGRVLTEYKARVTNDHSSIDD